MGDGVSNTTGGGSAPWSGGGAGSCATTGCSSSVSCLLDLVSARSSRGGSPAAVPAFASFTDLATESARPSAKPSCFSAGAGLTTAGAAARSRAAWFADSCPLGEAGSAAPRASSCSLIPDAENVGSAAPTRRGSGGIGGGAIATESSTAVSSRAGFDAVWPETAGPRSSSSGRPMRQNMPTASRALAATPAPHSQVGRLRLAGFTAARACARMSASSAGEGSPAGRDRYSAATRRSSDESVSVSGLVWRSCVMGQMPCGCAPVHSGSAISRFPGLLQ